MDKIGLSKILNKQENMDKLPDKFKSDENGKICVTYKLGSSIRNKIFNYEDTVESINVQEPPDLTRCTCSQSEFKDPDHGHIITGNLNIVEDEKLRNLLSKGPNYREPKLIRYNQCKY